MDAMKKTLACLSITSILLGILVCAGGVWGIAFTYANVTQEHITTPGDASIPQTAVRGPLTLKSQVNVIRDHTLDSTEHRTYAQMSRDEDRSIWITATSLMTALNLAIIAFAFSALSILLGIFMITTGLAFRALQK